MSCLKTMISPLNKVSCNTDKEINITGSVPVKASLKNFDLLFAACHASHVKQLYRHAGGKA